MSCAQILPWSAFFLAPFLKPENSAGQPPGQYFLLEIRPVFSGRDIFLDAPFFDKNGDSLAFHELKFYVGNVDFLKKGRTVFSEKSHHLLDLEDEKSLVLAFQIPENLAFDSLRFDLGVDSLTNVSGAMGGDLDPTRGMFWTWQSGYINIKIEGFSARSPARNHEFQFHLGGYLPPFQTVQNVALPVFQPQKMRAEIDLALFFESVDWAENAGTMSPGGEAARLSSVLAKSFSAHEK